MPENIWSMVADEHLLRFRDQWNPTHAAVERWLIQQSLKAEGKEQSEEFDLLQTLDHPDWQPDAIHPHLQAFTVERGFDA